MAMSQTGDSRPSTEFLGPADVSDAGLSSPPIPSFIRQASDNAAASLTECFCTELIESKPGNLRLKCGCLLHYECLVMHIRSKSSDEMRSANGVDCPYKKAGQCLGSKGFQIITTNDMNDLVDYMDGVELSLSIPMLSKDEVCKFRRWISEGLHSPDVGHTEDIKELTDGEVSSADSIGRSGLSNKHSKAEQRTTNGDFDPTLSYITATTKPCPVCKYRATHFHGHSCHHTLEGCPGCHVEFCYKCLATEAQNIELRGSRPKCLCGGWSNFCKSNNILENLVLVPYPHDKRCGCPICPDCRPGKKCDFCFGDCVVCRDIIRPGPSELGPDGTCSHWEPQTETQRASGAGSASWVAEARPAFLTIARDPTRIIPPLVLAIREGRWAAVSDLLENPDVDINRVDPNGQSALQAAILTGELSIVRALLSRREININSPDNNGRTPLIRAAIIGNEHIIRMLVERSDLDVNAVDSWGLTALHCAAQRGFFGPCEWLLSREHIDVSVVDKHGCTAMDRASISGHPRIVSLIQAHIDAFFPDGSFCVQRNGFFYISVARDWAPTPGSEGAAAESANPGTGSVVVRSTETSHIRSTNNTPEASSAPMSILPGSSSPATTSISTAAAFGAPRAERRGVGSSKRCTIA